VAGIYIHIPFCKQKCTYCDFHFSTTFETYRDEMVNAICLEIEIRAKDFLADDSLTTIYFGGGTPSLLTKTEIDRILNTIKTHVDYSKVEEITFEANPDDISSSKLIEWKESGINRLSIGLQSFRQRDLDWMNRAHNVDEGEFSIKLAQNHGFNNLTVDLIYGLPDLSEDEWREHIQRLCDLNVPHISAYCLTVEQKTALQHMVKQKKLIIPNEDAQSRQFEILVETLENAGYEQYEISNFSKPQMHSRHNSNYWRNEVYLGIGPSAHSFDRLKRYWNIANNTKYIKLIQTRELPIEEEVLSLENRFNELIMTGLRTKWGVNMEVLDSILPLNNEFHSTLGNFVNAGDLISDNNHLYLTKKGKLKADYIASSLFV